MKIIPKHHIFIEKASLFQKTCYQKLNENELYVLKDYKFVNPLITKIDSINDNCYRDCHNKCFHTFKYVCIYDIKLTNITNKEKINISLCDESLGLYELKKKLTIARQRGFYIESNKLTNNKSTFTSTIYKHKLLSKSSNSKNASAIF